MTQHYATPGVYIEESTPGAPIQGVGTSTAAFLGPSAEGPLNEPTKVTSWDQFRQIFGELPSGFYLWYAVRGFFENGGTVCYVTRVSNGKSDYLLLNDRSTPTPGKPTIYLWARTPGDNTGNPIKVIIGDDNAVTGTGPNASELFKPSASVKSASGRAIEVQNLTDATNFLSGSSIVINDSTNSDTAVVSRIEGKIIHLIDILTYSYGNTAKVQLAGLQAGRDDTFLAENCNGLAAGSVIELLQGTIMDTQVVRRVDMLRTSPSLTLYRVTLRNKLTKDFDLSATANSVNVKSLEFKLEVRKGIYRKPYEKLSMDPSHPRYFAAIINGDTDGVIFAQPVEPPNATLPPKNRPKATSTLGVALADGQDENNQDLHPVDYKNALKQLEAINDVNIVAIPDRNDADVQFAMISHCEEMKDRFAILDSGRAMPPFGAASVEEQRRGLNSSRGFAALYYPWLKVSPASGTDPILVPPSGHIAGIYARTDQNRGVHKAPAGNEALVNGALGVERTMSDTDQGQLNLQGINVVRVFTGGGRPVVWGARTTAGDLNRNWQYVNIRRLMNFIEESIEEGIRWAVFEPNNLQLWQKLKRTITDFLTRVWRDGALFGATAKDAFYVRIDEALNPPSTQALGRLYIEIGVRPVYPAEFIIVRIGIWPGGSEVSES